MKIDKTKLGKAVGVLGAVTVAVMGVAMAASGESVEAMEKAYQAQLEAAKASVEALCHVEQSLAIAKLEAKGAAFLPVEELTRLQLKAKGENLECRF